MMIVIFFRILILAALAVLLYTVIQYINNPKRRLDLAKSSDEFYIVDEANNSLKNIQFVYKGCLFEGEKYLGTAGDSFEVVTIQVAVPHPMELKGLSRDDLYFLEKELLILYPYADIEWKHPINQLFLSSND